MFADIFETCVTCKCTTTVSILWAGQCGNMSMSARLKQCMNDSYLQVLQMPLNVRIKRLSFFKLVND